MPRTRLHVFDLHCDTLDRLALHNVMPQAGFMTEDAAIPAHRMASLLDNDAHISLDRMAQANWCQCFAAFIPDGLGMEGAWQVFQVVNAYLQAQLKQHVGRIELVRDAREIEDIIKNGTCAAIFTVEGGSFLEGSVNRLYDIAEAGVKMMTLTWNGQNAIASGNDTMDGLSFFGREVIETMDQLRMVVDVSHLNDNSFWDVMKHAKRPVAASHSNARAVCGHPRNLTDSQFRAIAERGGLVGLNFYSRFLKDFGEATPDDFCWHIDHLLELGGETVLALGSDYDGCDVPRWLAPCNKIDSLYEVIAKQFGPEIAERIFFDNALEFFKRNETMGVVGA